MVNRFRLKKKSNLQKISIKLLINKILGNNNRSNNNNNNNNNKYYNNNNNSYNSNNYSNNNNNNNCSNSNNNNNNNNNNSSNLNFIIKYKMSSSNQISFHLRQRKYKEIK